MKDLIRRILREQIIINEFALKSNTDEFIKKAKKVHGDKYTYDNVDYKDANKPVSITCPKHGDFLQKPSGHLQGKGCRNCYFEKKRYNTDEFIERAKKIHGDKYTYDNVDYKGTNIPVDITCKKHGDFSQKPTGHLLLGNGCPKCQYETRRLNTNDFIEKAKKVHGDKYIYDNVDYKNSREPINITCPKHGDFSIVPNSHLRGLGCRDCYLENRWSNTDEFIERAKKVHGNKYTYDNVDYKGSDIPVDITCPKHGDFLQKPANHLIGQGCKDCFLENQFSNTDEFIEKAKKVHGDKYTYDNVDYKGSDKLVDITCPKHGDFSQQAYSHLRGGGCPKCSESKGESIISKLLNTLEIQFVKEKKFEDCKNSKVGRYCRRLPFDFYLPEFNVVIEYDGKQHFEPIKQFGGEETYKRIQINDEIKNKYCKDNGIKMIRIPYTIKFDDILSLLKNELGITG
jgi:very-short-patch-repair endonuclease